KHASNAREDTSGSTPPPIYDDPQSTFDPINLSRWAEFHERVADLPDDERLVFDLVWYQGLSQPAAAEVLGISERTVKRRWLSARITLGSALGGSAPC